MGAKQEPLTESYFYILLCLHERPRHGYGIMQRVQELSDGHVRIGSGTMYGATANLMQKGWIRERKAEERRREYELTDAGEKALRDEFHRLRHLAAAADRVMTADPQTAPAPRMAPAPMPESEAPRAKGDDSGLYDLPGAALSMG